MLMSPQSAMDMKSRAATIGWAFKHRKVQFLVNVSRRNYCLNIELVSAFRISSTFNIYFVCSDTSHHGNRRSNRNNEISSVCQV